MLSWYTPETIFSIASTDWRLRTTKQISIVLIALLLVGAFVIFRIVPDVVGRRINS